MQVAKNKENLKKCVCMDCPSYSMGCKIKNFPENMIKLMNDLDDVEHYEKMFCAFGKSHCISEDKGCLCETCPVYHENDLHREDYCIKTGGQLSHQCWAGYSDEKEESDLKAH